MKYTELKNDIQQGARAIYLLEGEDAYFRMKGEEMLKAAFVEYPELNYSSFDGETLKGGALTSLTSAIESFPFMAEKRVIKVSELHPSESEYESYLKKTFENFPSTTVLIIVNAESRKGVDLKRKKSVCYVDCGKADEETVAKWAYLTLKRAGIISSAEACLAIARYCLCNMSRVALEVEKLIDYKKHGELKREEVDELVFKDADYRIYEMTNAVASGNYEKYLAVQSDLCRKAGDETSVLSGLFSYFKNLLMILTSEASESELATLLKMKEYGIKKSREQARMLGERKLINFTEAVYSALSDIKSGQLTPESALLTVNGKLFFS